MNIKSNVPPVIPVNSKKVSSLVKQIVDANRIFVDGHTVDYINSSEITNEPNNAVVIIEWERSEGEDYRVELTEGHLTNAIIDGNKILVHDQECIETVIELMKYTEVKVEINW